MRKRFRNAYCIAFLSVAAARWSRQRLLLALMAFFAVGNFASAVAPGYASLIGVRFLAGGPVEGASPARELSALSHKQVWLTLGVGSIGFGGLFCVYSYITPTLIQVSGLPVRYVPFVLTVFGGGMILGNLIGSWLADRTLMRAIGALLIWNVIVLGTFSLVAPHAWMATVVVLLIGTGVAIVPALQVRLMDVAGNAQTLAAALNHSAFNIANALGAWLGGLAIARGLGWASTGWVGALLALGGLFIFGLSVAEESRCHLCKSSIHRISSGVSTPSISRL